MKVAAIIVTYNRKKLLLENIEALLHPSIDNDILTIIVVDNHSTDGTAEAVEPYSTNKKIIYLDTGKNLGGAGGFHYGIKYVAEHNFDYIWIMDDDCIPTSNALEALLNASKKINKSYGFLASKVLWKDNTICKMNVQRISLWKNVDDWKSSIVPIIMSSFVSLFVPVKNVRDFGLPIKEFFIWTDDWEFTRRISRNLPCYLVNDSIVVHKSNNNFGANIATEDVDRLDRYNYLYRNDVFLYRREGLEGILYELLRIGFHTLKVLKDAPNKKIIRLMKIYKATYKGLSFSPTIEFPLRK